MTRPCTSWPERYYEETDPEKRRLLLEQAMTAGEGDAAENEVRRRLWELRYTRPRRNAPLADRYIALWLALDHWRKPGLAPRQVRAAQKELEELAGLLRPEGGADLVLISIGALADDAFRAEVEQTAARCGRTSQPTKCRCSPACRWKPAPAASPAPR